jgi:hypothetical protein
MTRITPDEKCVVCGSLLIPPEIASGFRIPHGTDYVCMKCGRPYRWTGNPPKLTTLNERRTDGEGDED